MRLIVSSIAFFLFASCLSASSVSVWSVNSSVTDGPVVATAQFTQNGSTLVVVLTNNLSDPRSAGQLVSDLIIMGLGGTPTLDTNINDTFSTEVGSNTPVAPGWGFGQVSLGWEICIICPDSINPPGHAAPPNHLIIGSGPDPDGNASIGVHSPSLNGSAQFTITGIDPNSSVTGATISFGTEGTEIAAVSGGPSGGPTGSAVPEPGVLSMVGGGLLLLLAKRHMWKAKRL